MTTIEKDIERINAKYPEEIQDEHLREIEKKKDVSKRFDKFLKSAVKLQEMIIYALFSSNEKNKFSDYKAIMLKLKDKYLHGFNENEKKYLISKTIQDFDINHHLFLQRTNDIAVIIDCILAKKEIPFEIYEHLSFISKVKSYSLLHKNWDTYNAAKINKAIINKVIKFIVECRKTDKTPVFVAPLNNGGVKVAFKKDKTRIELNFESKEIIKAMILKDRKIEVIDALSSAESAIAYLDQNL